MDWSHLQSFVAVADSGSLSAAAREIGSSQPTLGRAIHALESDLGVELFVRNPRGLSLTEQGEELYSYASEMAAQATRLQLAAEGRADTLNGTVRITASQIVATYILPPILAEMRQQEPDIQIELVATNRVENLLYREADIAIRMVRPTQQDLLARKVGDMQLGLFATDGYLARHGEPHDFADVFDLNVIGYDRSELIVEGAAEYGFRLDRDSFDLRCDDQVTYWQLVLAGCGIGFSPVVIGQRYPGVTRILPDAVLPQLPVWLTTHPVLKSNRRVRFAMDFLAQKLRDALSEQEEPE